MGNLQSAIETTSDTLPDALEGSSSTTFTPIRTWNGALSYDSVRDPLVEIFFKSVRDMPATDYQAVTPKPTKNGSRHRGLHRFQTLGWKVLSNISIRLG